ncbi:uncharacterized protein VTP21DRAFT_5468 [Calcarisporiella thermophila]|uniref:uncharacterized protein n=1 Tax=Calcarisporiella thermophila TaxID=911321 RepID=UPI003742CDFA
MGLGFLSGRFKELREAKRVSAAIDMQLTEERMDMVRDKSAKILLLGSAESGKTTVLKQIRLLHGDNLASLRGHFKHVVYLNILHAIHSLAVAMLKNHIAPTSANATEALHTIVNLETLAEPILWDGKLILGAPFVPGQPPPHPGSVFQREEYIGSLFHATVPAILTLWADESVQDVYKMGIAEGLQDTAKYFLDNVERMASYDYAPIDDDIVQARVRSWGISEHCFTIDNRIYKIYDVAGHQSQRKYWAPYFDNCHVIIFVAAVSAFDQTLAENTEVNRLKDSVDLFESICNHPLLVSTPSILFLNKTDVLKRKLESGVRVAKFFSNYRGSNEFESVVSYFGKKFLRRNKTGLVYIHLTHATDTKHMRLIVSTVILLVQRMMLKTSGLL